MNEYSEDNPYCEDCYEIDGNWWRGIYDEPCYSDECLAEDEDES